MDTQLELIVKVLQQRFGARLEEFRGEAHVFLKPVQITEALRLLRDQHQFELLSALTVVDYWPQEAPRFHVVYQLSSLAKNLTVQLRVPVHARDPRLPTATGVYLVANWREREIYDMFGIYFTDHPDLRRILMPRETEGHPLRRDFPLGYEEPQFTFNYEEIDLRKPYAKE